MPERIPDPHAGQPVLAAGKPLAEAGAVMILVHGRGATASSILDLARALPHTQMAYLAPQAAGNTWYPYSFLAPLAQNEPWLNSALARLDAVVEHVLQAGVPANKIILAGFSQGACLASEYTARYPRPYGGLLAFSGGLIGPKVDETRYSGSLAGVPVFMGCSDVDFHIPKERVVESAAALGRLGAQVEYVLYPNMDHTIIQDEIDRANVIVSRL